MFFISEAQFEKAIKRVSDERLKVYSNQVREFVERFAKEVLESEFGKVYRKHELWLKQNLPYYVKRVLRGDEQSAAEIDAYIERSVRNFAPTKESFINDDKFIKELIKAINEYQLKND